MFDITKQSTPDADLGARLRAERTDRARSLTETAAQAGLSKGFLSQLERGRTRASIATLRRLAAVLEIPLPELLTEPDATGDRVEIRPKVSRHRAQGADRLLTPTGLPGFQVLDSTVPPGGASAGAVVDPVPTAHLLLIREGTFTVRIDGSPYRLQSGDSLAFASPPAYAWRNEGSEPTRLVWVLAPPLPG
jgi:transcriptional regulator with XRE-family HTH domain